MDFPNPRDKTKIERGISSQYLTLLGMGRDIPPQKKAFPESTGFELCTESLGSESCCEGSMVGEGEEEEIEAAVESEETMTKTFKSRRNEAEEIGKEFPPPLPWLMQGSGEGSSCCCCCWFMKAVRRDGRLVLAEVSIERPEVLHASRENGRLRLQFVRSEEEGEEGIGKLEEEIEQGQVAVEGEVKDGAAAAAAAAAMYWKRQLLVT